MADAKSDVKKGGAGKPPITATPVVPEKMTVPPVAPVIVNPTPAPAPSTPIAAPTPVAVLEEGIKKMNDTMNNTAHNAADTAHNFAAGTSERATEMFGDVATRAKSAMEKSSKALEEMVEMSKGNIEAVVASGRVAAQGAQDIAKYSAEYGRKTIEEANATAKRFAAVKSPTEFFQLQSEVAKSSLDAMVAEASKFMENYMKLIGEVTQPLQNRAAVAVDKVKNANNG